MYLRGSNEPLAGHGRGWQSSCEASSGAADEIAALFGGDGKIHALLDRPQIPLNKSGTCGLAAFDLSWTRRSETYVDRERELRQVVEVTATLTKLD
jgi:hypothetical protein